MERRERPKAAKKKPTTKPRAGSSSTATGATIFVRVEILAAFIEEHAADESLYDETTVTEADQQRHTDTTQILQNSCSRKRLLRILPTTSSASEAFLALMASFRPEEVITLELAQFLNTHLPVAFVEREVAARVSDQAMRAWNRIAQHVNVIANSRPAESRSPAIAKLSETLAEHLVESAPSVWAQQKAARLYHELVAFLRASRHQSDNLAPLERVIVDPDHVLPRALCIHYTPTDKPAMEQIARALVRVHAANGACVSLVREFISADVRNAANPSNVLEADCWTTLLFREYTGLLGREYLVKTLGGIVKRVVASPEKYEIDPERLAQMFVGFSKDEMSGFLRTNQQELLHVSQLAVDFIATSINSCPGFVSPLLQQQRPRHSQEHSGIRLLTKQIQSCLMERFDSSDRVRHRIVASILFIRFFCTALLDSQLFSHNETVIEPLVTIAKVLQQTASGTPPFESRLQFLTPWIGEHIATIDNFVDAWVELPWPEDGKDPEPIWKGDIAPDLRNLAQHFRRHESDLEVLTHSRIRAKRKIQVLIETLSREKIATSAKAAGWEQPNQEAEARLEDARKDFADGKIERPASVSDEEGL